MTAENKATLRRAFWWRQYAVGAGVLLFLFFFFTTRRSPVSSAQFVPALQGDAVSGIYTAVADGDPSPLGSKFVSDGTPALGLGENALNDAGDLVLRVDGPQAKIVLVKSGQEPVTLVTAGDPAPGGGTYLGVGLSKINNLGDVGFGGLIDVQQAAPLGRLRWCPKAS